MILSPGPGPAYCLHGWFIMGATGPAGGLEGLVPFRDSSCRNPLPYASAIRVLAHPPRPGRPGHSGIELLVHRKLQGEKRVLDIPFQALENGPSTSFLGV